MSFTYHETLVGQAENQFSAYEQYPGKKSANLGKEDFFSLLAAQPSPSDSLYQMEGRDFSWQQAQYTSLEWQTGIPSRHVAPPRRTDTQEVPDADSAMNAENMDLGVAISKVDGELTTVAFDIDEPAANCSINIVDAGGNPVKTVQVGAVQAGTCEKQWDGTDSNGQTVPNGVYYVAIVAENEAGKPIEVQTRASQKSKDAQAAGQQAKAGKTGQPKVAPKTDAARARNKNTQAAGQQAEVGKASQPKATPETNAARAQNKNTQAAGQQAEAGKASQPKATPETNAARARNKNTQAAGQQAETGKTDLPKAAPEKDAARAQNKNFQTAKQQAEAGKEGLPKAAAETDAARAQDKNTQATGQQTEAGKTGLPKAAAETDAARAQNKNFQAAEQQAEAGKEDLPKPAAETDAARAQNKNFQAAEQQAETGKTDLPKAAAETDAAHARNKNTQAAGQQAEAGKGGLPKAAADTQAARTRNENAKAVGQHGTARRAARENVLRSEAEGPGTGKGGESFAGAGRDALKAKVEPKPFARDELSGFNRLFNLAPDRSAQASVQPEAPHARSAGLNPQRLMQTIKTGALTNLGEGRRQLTLTLEPETLGKLTIVLQIQNKEVTALIRTENQDVTQMLADNMHLLRQHLEQQGLKVEKLDVQTQLSNEHAFRDWQGAQQHNQAQEQETRQRVLSSMRLLRSTGEEQADLAQDMQYKGQREKNSLNAVDLFA